MYPVTWMLWDLNLDGSISPFSSPFTVFWVLITLIFLACKLFEEILADRKELNSKNNRVNISF